MNSAALVSFFRIVLLLGSVLTAIKLYRTGLYKQYPVFFAFIIFRVPNSLWPLYLNDVHSDRYFQVWVLTDPIGLGFYVLMVMELYRLVLDRYKGLYSLGRKALYVSLAVSV